VVAQKVGTAFAYGGDGAGRVACRTWVQERCEGMVLRL